MALALRQQWLPKGKLPSSDFSGRPDARGTFHPANTYSWEYSQPSRSHGEVCNSGVRRRRPAGDELPLVAQIVCGIWGAEGKTEWPPKLTSRQRNGAKWLAAY
jgi:hypothetical protein